MITHSTRRSETNNAGFEVQHIQGNASDDSSDDDPSDWNVVTFVEGHGTTNEAQRYSFRVDELAAGTHHFRLRQLDTDGTATLSESVDVEIGVEGRYELSQPAPNPVRSHSTLTLAVDTSQDVSVTLYDVLGRRVATLHDGSLAANTSLPLTLQANDLPSGTYVVQVDGETFTADQRVTVVR